MANTENKNNNLNIIVVVLLLLLAVWAFFMGKNMNSNTVKTNNTDVKTNTWANNTATVTWELAKDLTITVIGDKRCTDCQTKAVEEQLQLVPNLKNAKFVEKDYSEDGVKALLEATWIERLPAFIFSNNNVAEDMKWFLVATKDGKFSLNTWASFNPTAKRSDRGFLLVEKETLKSIKDNSFVKWNKDAKITWLEYSDLECPFCAKLHNSDTPDSLEKKYGEKINKIFNHFPLGFHKNALPWAQILECIWEVKGSEWFYGLMEKAFKDQKSDKDYLIVEAVKLWANKTTLETCLASKKFDTKINDQQNVGSKEFGVTWTPWSVLINNETGEYKVLSWAYPTAEFEKIIDKLLK